MLTVLPDGEQRFRLVDPAGRDVGWIRRRAVRFFGFTSKSEVMKAAVTAWRAMRAVVNGEASRWEVDELRVVHDGAYEWISDGRIPIARLFRERSPDGAVTSFAIELIMPQRALAAAFVPLYSHIVREPLGLESKTVRVVPYDDRWPALYTSEARAIAAAVAKHGLAALALEHVGSTSVPGLAAKPILDIAAGYANGVDPASYIAALESLGYIYRGDGGLPGREFFRKGALRTHHVHLVERGGPHWRRYLEFRDALRGDPKLRDAYARLKLELMQRHPRDREAYIEGKTEFVESVLAP